MNSGLEAAVSSGDASCPICYATPPRRAYALRPCQHTFCYECILGCFRATKTMACPLCKAPAWKRQLAQNHTLAGIIRAFREVAPETAAG